VRLRPVSREEAMELWEELSEQEVECEQAFPGAEVEDA
jgi:hypothetical protein